MELIQSNVLIKGDYITLGQLLKFLNLVSTGGEEKIFVLEHDISVNGVKENRRGRKLRPSDKVTIDGKGYSICSSEN